MGKKPCSISRSGGLSMDSATKNVGSLNITPPILIIMVRIMAVWEATRSAKASQVTILLCLAREIYKLSGAAAQEMLVHST